MSGPEENPYRLAEEFRSRAANIVGNFVTNVNAAQVPNIIYHYTDGAGLLGILQSGKLWKPYTAASGEINIV